jgi:hypothetical protein
MLFIEKLDATLEDYLLSDECEDKVIRSCLFQIAFALTYLQRHYDFTHNDLHISNVMYQETNTQYLYYKLNNRYFRVPTYGKIFKIIDFGRAIFTFKHKVYRNDVFERNSEAGGQYGYPHQVSFLHNHPNDRYNTLGDPNPSFDLCRLAITIMDEGERSMFSDDTYDLLRRMCRYKHNQSFCDMRDDFNLYIAIARDSHHAIPQQVVVDSVFRLYRVTKKKFPKKLFYTI